MNDPYQLFSKLDADTENALRSSIGKYGVLVPIVFNPDGDVLDGHHRLRIARDLNIPYPSIFVMPMPYAFNLSAEQAPIVLKERESIRKQAQASAYAIDDLDDEQSLFVEVPPDASPDDIARTLNLDRRHLDVEQRRAVVADLRQGGHSLRAIAGAVGVSKTQVQKDIKQVSTGGHLTVVPDAMPAKVTGKDGKLYPSTQAKAPRPSNDPDEWDDERWEKFDHEVGKALDLVLRARNWRQRGIYKPSSLVAAKLVLVGPADLDAELASLLEERS